MLESITTTAFLDNAISTTLSSAMFVIATIAPLPTSPLPIMNIGIPIPTGTLAGVFVTATATAAAVAASSDSPKPEPPNGECRLLGPFALIVQAALGGLALLALVYKRWRERPQRPMKIWAFDVSKQVVGSVLVHIANLLMSLLSSGQLSIKLNPSTLQPRAEDSDASYQPNPCSFYLLNLAIDTTIGIPILIILLRLWTALFLLTPFGNPPESIQSGNYGHPPKTMWWFKQSMIYFIGLMGMKICVLAIFILLPWISRVGDWALSWTEGNEQLQVFFVMLFFPVIMNATQYYIIDSFIKNQKPGAHELLVGDRESYDENGDQPSGSSEEVGSEDEDDAPIPTEVKPQPVKKHKRKTGANRHAYEATFDGENSPTVVGSGSSERGALLAKDLGSDSEEDIKPSSR